MKVKKESLDISNRKKNALPSSKLLKPKKFKSSMKKYGDGNKLPISTDKLKLVNDDIDSQLDLGLDNQSKTSKRVKSLKSSTLKGAVAPLTNSPKKSKNILRESKTKKISNLFDFVGQQSKELNGKEKGDDKSKNTSLEIRVEVDTNEKGSKKELSNKTAAKDSQEENKRNASNKQTPKANKIKHSQNKISKGVVRMEDITKRFNLKQDVSKNLSGEKQTSKPVNAKPKKDNEMIGIDKCRLKLSKVAAVAKGLLKLIDETTSSKPEFLDVGEPVFLQLECIKIPICATKQLRIKLPYPLTNETSDVLLITADLKGHKIYPDRAVDHYEELLSKLQINFIPKVMPLRMVKKEYSQYEMRRKLVDQFDIILADSRIIKSLSAVLGKFALYKRKMPIPVNLTIGEPKLKKHLQDAINKTQMTVKSNGHTSIVQVGHSKMSAKEIAANIVEVAKSLENLYPGGWRNIRSLVVKTAKSTSLPVYLSLLSPNEVKIPVETRRKPQPVEDELSTMPGHNVIVTADGNVILKKIEEDFKIDDSKDDEILEEAEKYLESSKTVRYDESSDEDKKEEKGDSESDDEGEAITEAMEKKLMNKYTKSAKAKNKKDEEDEDEEEEEEEDGESEEESGIVPVIGKKRKSQGTKKQSGLPAKKAFNQVESKGISKMDKSNKESKKVDISGSKKPQTRGTRGGKKNKMSKDQRKALIKRKKAGKK